MREADNGQFVGPCYKCKAMIWLPLELVTACRNSHHHSFFCPYGHEQVFPEGETEAETLRRERDLLKQRLAQKDDEILMQRRLKEIAEKQALTYRTSIGKANRRAKVGLCPCCNRSFRQMALHMKNKHPNFKAEVVA